jgi:hypothetical protein
MNFSAEKSCSRGFMVSYEDVIFARFTGRSRGRAVLKRSETINDENALLSE